MGYFAQNDYDYEGKHNIAQFRNTVRTTIRRQVAKRTFYWSLTIVSALGLLDYSAKNWGEIDIQREFSYPLNVPNLSEVVEQYRFKLVTDSALDYKPLNKKYSSVPFIKTTVHSTQNIPHGLIIVVKSAIRNYEKRAAIRETWGHPNYLRDTQLSSTLPTKLVFICGVPANFNPLSEKRLDDALFPDEFVHDDIIVADFVDQYSNNTYKTMLALKWAVQEFPSEFQYMFLVDDDMYVDVANLVESLTIFPNRRFIMDHYEPAGPDFAFYRHTTIYNKNYSVVSGKSILKTGLYFGQVYWDASPIRGTYFVYQSAKSDWCVPLETYAYNLYPPYIPGAAITFSKEAVHKLYYGSLFVKHFAIDDVYLGIIANKLGMFPVTSGQFTSGYPSRSGLKIDKNIISESIAIHGCQCTAQMVDLWRNRNPGKLLPC